MPSNLVKIWNSRHKSKTVEIVLSKVSIFYSVTSYKLYPEIMQGISYILKLDIQGAVKKWTQSDTSECYRQPRLHELDCYLIVLNANKPAALHLSEMFCQLHKTDLLFLLNFRAYLEVNSGFYVKTQSFISLASRCVLRETFPLQ